jgi:uncharacterized zinc-type alcohol dehydrogenase-like protein
MSTFTVKAYGAESKTADLQELHIERREVTAKDVEIEILYCGVCHSDLHTARNDWGGSMYPVVPGHEIVGRMTNVGSEVSKFKVGDLAAVGCMVDSCGIAKAANMILNNIARMVSQELTTEKTNIWEVILSEDILRK